MLDRRFDRFPSMKRLQAWFPKADPERLRALRSVAKSDDPHEAALHLMYDQGILKDYHYAYPGYELVLQVASWALGGFGVESVGQAFYVNMGDTYAGTLLYNVYSGAFSLTTWGDYMERHYI